MIRSTATILWWGLVASGVGSIAYDALAPNFAHWRASDWQADADHVSADVKAIDLKGCRYIDGATVGQVHESDAWRRTNITVDHPQSPFLRVGSVNMGRWDWQKVKSGEIVDRVMATATFLCADAQVPVQVGPFDVGK